MTPDIDIVLSENHSRLVRVARQYAGNNDWQDLLQEIAVNLWRGLESFDGRAQLSTWVFRVAINTALQYVRKPRPTTDALPMDTLQAEETGDPMHMLTTFLHGLDPVNRAVLLMDLEGLDRHEIGDVLGLSGGAVAVRMTRLKERFSEQFVETG